MRGAEAGQMLADQESSGQSCCCRISNMKHILLSEIAVAKFIEVMLSNAVRFGT